MKLTKLIEKTYPKNSEEYKAIEWLENKKKDYNASSIDLHYYTILYYFIMYLFNKNKELKDNYNMELDENVRLSELFCKARIELSKKKGRKRN
jgi:hypothetical protein